MYHSQRMTVKEIQEATGVSAATIYRELKKEQNQ
jgi:DeoR/GlpR family transcriptional regulator of sugar metabolism